MTNKYEIPILEMFNTQQVLDTETIVQKFNLSPKRARKIMKRLIDSRKVRLLPNLQDLRKNRYIKNS